ncbi:MAG: diphosphomevalonate decarboxylase [Anaerolineales bacterium]
MATQRALAVASPNIALLKYWGNRDARLRIPANDSLSLTLSRLETRTSVQFDETLKSDQLILNGVDAPDPSTRRAAGVLDVVRKISGRNEYARIESENNFPMGAGIASSASAYAALALAASAAAGLRLEEQELSRLARLGSGSAARSVFGGYVVLHAGRDHDSAFAEQLFPCAYWPLVDVVAVVEQAQKEVGSTGGHELAPTSPLQQARIQDSPRRLQLARHAIEMKDFELLAAVSELDSNMMHAVMLTSNPPLFYVSPASLEIMLAVIRWRTAGDPVFYTLDAGPNVHCITTPDFTPTLISRLQQEQDVKQVLEAPMGNGAHLNPA